MDPRVLKGFLVLPLAAGPLSPAQPSVYRTVSAYPVQEWPVRLELPEEKYPHDHPTDEGSTPMFLGLGGYANISNTATVTVHSPSLYENNAIAAWVPNNFPLVVSTRDFLIERFEPVTRPIASLRVQPDPKGHVPNLEARRFTGSRSGRG